MTHSEHAKQAGVSTPCSAYHLTYGGRCLNCGYDPRPQEARDLERAVAILQRTELFNKFFRS